jgi:hypothetical protein
LEEVRTTPLQTLTFEPENPVLDIKFKICWLENAVYALREYLNPIYLDTALCELFLNRILQVVFIVM